MDDLLSSLFDYPHTEIPAFVFLAVVFPIWFPILYRRRVKYESSEANQGEGHSLVGVGGVVKETTIPQWGVGCGVASGAAKQRRRRK